MVNHPVSTDTLTHILPGFAPFALSGNQYSIRPKVYFDEVTLQTFAGEAPDQSDVIQCVQFDETF